MSTGLCIVILVIIAIVYTAYQYHSYRDPTEYLYGSWKGDSNIAQEAGAKSIQLFIGDKTGNTRNAYLLIMDDICNSPFTIKCNKCREVKPTDPLAVKNHVKSYELQAELAGLPPDTWPQSVTLQFNTFTGTLRVFSDSVLYGLFYKDNEVTNIVA